MNRWRTALHRTQRPGARSVPDVCSSGLELINQPSYLGCLWNYIRYDNVWLRLRFTILSHEHGIKPCSLPEVSGSQLINQAWFNKSKPWMEFCLLFRCSMPEIVYIFVTLELLLWFRQTELARHHIYDITWPMTSQGKGQKTGQHIQLEDTWIFLTNVSL